MATAATSAPGLVWFKRDLRLADNPALHAAVKSGRPLLLAYIRDADAELRLTPGAASDWWLHGSLEALAGAIARCGNRLQFYSGDPAQIIPQLCTRFGIEEVFWNQSFLPWVDQRDREIARALSARDCQPRVFRSSVLLDHATTLSKTGTPFKVFTPFWKSAIRDFACPRSLPSPDKIRAPERSPCESLESWQLLPDKPDWAAGLRAHWMPGEAAAHDRLDTFIKTALSGYKDERDRPDLAGTSRLSPHLAFGEISPRQVWNRMDRAIAEGASVSAVEKFLSEIGWREFSYYLFHHFGDLRWNNFNSRFDNFPWRDAPAALKRWQQGRTGIPLVDAGMRELWTTGWMHNRVRMITASYLIKHLGIHWKDGMRWFEDTLVDADPVVNATSWQWVAGSGADAAPYFRIFNPVTQGKTHDKTGAYIRRWVKELETVGAGRIHEPGQVATYPQPVMDLAEGRQLALAAFEAIKSANA